MKSGYVLGIGLLTALLIVPVVSLAQVSGQFSYVVADDIDLTLNPEIPGAFTNTTLSLNSYVTNMDRAYITWDVDGKRILAGYGKKQFSVKTGEVGSSMSIAIKVITSGGEVINKSVKISPSEAELLWEGADSYTPPFYKGRALPSPEGIVRVVAMPQIYGGDTLLDANDYIFKWKKEDKVMQEGSGYGKNAFLYRNSYLNPNGEKIEVTSQNNKTGAIGKNKVTIPVFVPKILFYEKNGLEGIRFQETLKDGFKIKSNDVTIVALPYFTSPKNPVDRDLSYEWKINNLIIPTPAEKNTLTIRKGQQSGVSTIGVAIKSFSKLFLEANASLSVDLN